MTAFTQKPDSRDTRHAALRLINWSHNDELWLETTNPDMRLFHWIEKWDKTSLLRV